LPGSVTDDRSRVAALHPRLVQSLTTFAAPHPLAARRAALRGRIGRASGGLGLEFQLPRLPERSLRQDAGARVERLLRAGSGPTWPSTADFAAAVGVYRSAIRIPGVAHCSMEYFRWAARSQLRAEGRRFAAAVARPVEVPVLQVCGAVDPWRLAAAGPWRLADPSAAAPWVGPTQRIELVPDVGHFPHEEQPGPLTELLADFLR